MLSCRRRYHPRRLHHYVTRGQLLRRSGCLHNSTLSTTANEESARPAARVVDVTDLALQMRASVRDYTESLGGESSKRVKLLGILAHDYKHDDTDGCCFCSSSSSSHQMGDAAELYSELIAETCREDGIDYELCRVTAGQQPSHVKDAIRDGNARADVDGILVYYPIFKKRLSSDEKRGPYKNRLTGVYYKTFDDYLRDAVSYTKDVEGLCQEYNARWLFRARGMDRIQNNTHVVYPCSALSVLRILESYHCKSSPNSWNGTTVTIVNRSEIFGRPLAAMLANAGATVYSVDVDSILLFRRGGRMRRCSTSGSSKTLQGCLQKSSVVVSGVPSPDFCVRSEWINPGTTFVNVSEYPNVCEESLLDIPAVQYIPQVGKVTIAILEQNLVELHRRYGKRQ